MISILAMACLIFLAFAQLIRAAMVTEMDVQTVMLLLLVYLGALGVRAMIHRRLS